MIQFKSIDDYIDKLFSYKQTLLGFIETERTGVLFMGSIARYPRDGTNSTFNKTEARSRYWMLENSIHPLKNLNKS